MTAAAQLGLLQRSSIAEAAEAERIHLAIESLPGCVEREPFRDEVTRLGGSFVEADGDAPARRFIVRVVDARPPLHVSLQIQDLVGRITERVATVEDCDAASSSLALFMATALDEAPPPFVPAPADLVGAETYWPAPAPPPKPRSIRRVGSGGIAADVFVGMQDKRGAHLFGAVRAFGTTRLGLAVMFQERDLDDQCPRAEYAASRSASGAGWCTDGHEFEEWNGPLTGRRRTASVGGLFGWGAPWNDSVAGFVGEIGVARGSDETQAGFKYAPQRRTRTTFTAPYVSASIVLQIPWRFSVRPFAAFRGTWIAAKAPDAPLVIDPIETASVHLGLAWQAW